MIRDVINELKKYIAGKKNTDKIKISVLVLNRLIFTLEEQEAKWISVSEKLPENSRNYLMTKEELEMRTLVRESDVIDKTDGSELAKAFNYLWEKYIEQEPSNDMVSREAFEQVMWERDVAIGQLHELGYGLGEKIRTTTTAGDGNCKECNHTEDECKDCYPELGYKNNKLKRDTEAVEEFVKSDFFKDLMESLNETREFCETAVKTLGKEPCEDAISREDVLMCLTGEIKDTDTIETIIARFIRRIRELPPVTPQQKTGHWISLDDFRGKYNERGFKCSKCDEHSSFEENFCPGCGAKMVEPTGQESEG